jgi:uncharacterized membrane protein
MKKYIKIYADIFLSDALLIPITGWTLFIFICMWIVPDRVVALQENSLAILTIETLVCILAIAWSITRVRRNLRKYGKV